MTSKTNFSSSIVYDCKTAIFTLNVANEKTLHDKQNKLTYKILQLVIHY